MPITQGINLPSSNLFQSNNYLSTDYFGTRLVIFDNKMNTIGNHFLYQVRGQMHFYSIHVITEYNLAGSEIICRQIISILFIPNGFKMDPIQFSRLMTWKCTDNIVLPPH